MGIGSTAMTQAKKLSESDPMLLEQVKENKIALDKAYRQVVEREKNQPKPENEKQTTKTILLATHTGDPVPYPKPKGKVKFNQTNEAVGWALWTWNPVTGCLHGCPYCYAREIANKDTFSKTYPIGFAPLFHHERLDAPLNTKVPAKAAKVPEAGRVFVCSMADLFGGFQHVDY